MTVLQLCKLFLLLKLSYGKFIATFAYLPIHPSKMRILEILHTLRIDAGDTTMAVNFCRRWSDVKDVEVEFLYFIEGENSYLRELRELGFRTHRIPVFPKFNPFVLSSFFSNINRFFQQNAGRFDIVHLHSPLFSHLILPFAKKHGVKQCIIHSHISVWNWHSNILKTIRNQILLRWLSVHKAHKWGCSKLACDSLYGKRAACTIIPNAIEAEKFKFNQVMRLQIRNELQLGAETAICCIGRFANQKNHSFLIDLFASLVAEYPNYHLYLVGEGENRGQIQNQIAKKGISRHVSLLGVRNDIPRLLQGMDIYIQPSLFEGLCISVIEAQAAGLPCIISNRFPSEAILIPDLCHIIGLEQPLCDWLNAIRDCDITNRRDTHEAIVKKGYDLTTASDILLQSYRDLLREC